MKWLLILFATYMLLLPCIPCNAAEVCCVEETTCAGEEKSCPADEHSCPEGAEAPAEEKEHHEHSPICPCCPSFSCNTCHSLVISQHFLLEEPGIPILNFDNVLFADEALAYFSAIIWQPPRSLC